MTGAARDVSVARKDLVVKKKLSDLGHCRIEGDEIIVAQRSGQVAGDRWACGEQKRGKDMRRAFHGVILASLLALATPSVAEIEEARDLMEAGRFEEAREALLPAAGSCNADAEELIGVMYALRLGVERHPERAF